MAEQQNGNNQPSQKNEENQNQQQQLVTTNLKILSQYAGNRVELYEKLSKLYDLPKLGPAVTLDYLKGLLSKNCSVFKIQRELTRPLPQYNFRRRFDAKRTFLLLENLLKKKNHKTTGFNSWQLPDTAWMLRIIIFLDPSKRKQVFEYNKKSEAKNESKEKML